MMTKTIWLVLVLGLLLRLILSAISYHSDLRAFDLAGWVMRQGNILNFYDYLPNLPADNFVVKVYPPTTFNYPPIANFFFSILTLPAVLLFGPGFQQIFLFNISDAFSKWQLPWFLLSLKIPYLIFDLGTAVLLTKLFSSIKEKQLVFLLWILNPVNLYATYMVGQFDIVPVFFVTLALFLCRENIIRLPRIALAALVLGIGAAFKIYPLFFLVPLATLLKSWRNRLVVIMVGIIPYILILTPFLQSKGFRATALVANQTLKSLYAEIPISGGEAIILFPVLLLFFYLLFYSFKRVQGNLWQDFFLIMLAFFIFTHYHPQWFLWLTPFLVISLVKSKLNHILPVLISLVSFFGLLFFFDSGLTLGLFAPVFPYLYNGPSLWQILKINIDYNFWRSILQTLFVSSAVYFIYYYFPKRTVD